MEDIKRLIGDKLVVDRNMKRLARHKPRMAQWLVGEIARRASGFFWVYLVVKSLINGLRNGDELAARTRYPNDVENLYGHILKQIPSEDKEDSSKIFLIFRANGNHPDIFTLYRALMFPDYHNVLQLGMYRPRGMKSTEYGQLAWQQYESGARRLGSRYLGLFELDACRGTRRKFSDILRTRQLLDLAARRRSRWRAYIYIAPQGASSSRNTNGRRSSTSLPTPNSTASNRFSWLFSYG